MTTTTDQAAGTVDVWLDYEDGAWVATSEKAGLRVSAPELDAAHDLAKQELAARSDGPAEMNCIVWMPALARAYSRWDEIRWWKD
jgi:hypothetical protein